MSDKPTIWELTERMGHGLGCGLLMRGCTCGLADLQTTLIEKVKQWRREACTPNADCGDMECLALLDCAAEIGIPEERLK
jgi:hypothetical protein